MAFDRAHVVHEVAEMLAQAARELCQHYGLAVSDSHSEANYPFAGTIDFAGEAGGIAGTLVIATDATVLASSRPTRATNDADLEDWACELANQLLGLFKKKLVAAGVGIRLSLPTCLRNPHSLESLEGVAFRTVVSFNTGRGPITVRWAANFPEGFALSAESHEQPETDLILF